MNHNYFLRENNVGNFSMNKVFFELIIEFFSSKKNDLIIVIYKFLIKKNLK